MRHIKIDAAMAEVFDSFSLDGRISFIIVLPLRGDTVGSGGITQSRTLTGHLPTPPRMWILVFVSSAEDT